MKVFITRPIPDKYNHLFVENNIEVDIYEKDEVCPREILLKRIPGADAVLTQWEDHVDKEFFDAAGEQLKIVAIFATGFDRADVVEAEKREIIITHTPTDELHWASAEAAVAILLSIAKRITKLYSLNLVNKLPEYSPLGEMGVAVRNRTTGIVGLGNIGGKVARIMRRGFNNKILYFGRSKKEELEKEINAEKVSLDELFSNSDFIFLTIPQTPETEKLITKEKIQLMKPRSILVSIVPPDLFDEEALVEAIENNKIYGAGLDVYTNTVKPASSHNLLLTSHMANMEEDVTLAMAKLCIVNIVAVLTGKAPLTPVK